MRSIIYHCEDNNNNLFITTDFNKAYEAKCYTIELVEYDPNYKEKKKACDEYREKFLRARAGRR